MTLLPGPAVPSGDECTERRHNDRLVRGHAPMEKCRGTQKFTGKYYYLLSYVNLFSFLLITTIRHLRNTKDTDSLH